MAGGTRVHLVYSLTATRKKRCGVFAGMDIVPAEIQSVAVTVASVDHGDPAGAEALSSV